MWNAADSLLSEENQIKLRNASHLSIKPLPRILPYLFLSSTFLFQADLKALLCQWPARWCLTRQSSASHSHPLSNIWRYIFMLSQMGIIGGFPWELWALWVDQEALFFHGPAPNETSSVSPTGQDAGVWLFYMVQLWQKNGDVWKY